MFTGVNFEKAIDYYRKGKEVIVLDRNSCGSNSQTGYDTFPFRELFENLDFLVDLPAVPNPDFEQAVRNMMMGSGVSVSPEDTSDQEPTESKTEESDSMDPSDEELLPPPSRRRNWRKKR